MRNLAKINLQKKTAYFRVAVPYLSSFPAMVNNLLAICSISPDDSSIKLTILVTTFFSSVFYFNFIVRDWKV